MTIRQFVNKAYPPDKRFGERWYPAFYPVRVTALAVTPLLVFLRLSPNAVSTGSILATVSAASLNATGNFGWGAIALFASLVLDAADGQVARMTGRSSRWGALLERIQADLSYLLIVPATAVGLAGDGTAEPVLAYLAFLGAGSYVVFRKLHARELIVNPSNLSWPVKIVLSQLKPQERIRSTTRMGAFGYHLQRNMVNQLGLAYPGLMIAGLWLQSWLEPLVLVLASLYLAMASLTLLAALVIAVGFRDPLENIGE